MPRTLHVDQYLSFRRSSKLIFIRGHQPEYGDERLTRDGTLPNPSRENKFSDANGDREKMGEYPENS